jgi:serine/threonine-protein kinase
VAFPAPEHPASEYLTVPDLRGFTIKQAEARLLQSGLGVRIVDSIYHPDAPLGTIIGQGPLPGQLAIAPDSVRLTVSLGAERRVIPDVSGLSEDRALILLRATGFTVQVDSLESDLPVGLAITTSPQAGAERTIPSDVRLSVSLGPPFLVMPDLIGLREEDARAILDSLGLIVAQVGERAQLFNPGEVVDQTPAPGSSIPNGSGVSIVISRRRFF